MTPSGAQGAMWRAVAVAGLVACLLQAASAGPGAAGAESATSQVRWTWTQEACADRDHPQSCQCHDFTWLSLGVVANGKATMIATQHRATGSPLTLRHTGGRRRAPHPENCSR